MQSGIAVVNVLDFIYPCRISMHFVEKEVCCAVRIKVFGEFEQCVGGKPDMVETYVEGFLPVGKCLLDMLKQHSGFAKIRFFSLKRKENGRKVSLERKESADFLSLERKNRLMGPDDDILWIFMRLRRVGARLHEMLSPAKDQFVCISKAEYQSAISNGIDKGDRLRVIENGSNVKAVEDAVPMVRH